MCEDEKALCVADMLSTHVWLHVTLFLLSQNLGLVLDARLDFFSPSPVSLNIYFVLLLFYGEKDLCANALSQSFWLS